MKTCIKCNLEKSLDQFEEKLNRCKDCIKEYRKNWKQNPDYKEQQRVYAQNKRKKFRLENPTIKIEKQPVVCVSCGKSYITKNTKKSTTNYCSKFCQGIGLRNKKSSLIKCIICSKEFFIWNSRLVGTHKQTPCCSDTCLKTYKNNLLNFTNCKQCNKEFRIKESHILESGNFCGRSCRAKYYNTNKTCGYIRSSLEKHIEQKLLLEFPDLEFICNDRKVLEGLELDFYFPKIKLAIELNGIVHYKDIYGENNLKKIQERDLRKAKLCEEKRIILHTINISKFINKNDHLQYWNLVKDIIVTEYNYEIK